VSLINNSVSYDISDQLTIRWLSRRIFKAWLNSDAILSNNFNISIRDRTKTFWSFFPTDWSLLLKSAQTIVSYFNIQILGVVNFIDYSRSSFFINVPLIDKSRQLRPVLNAIIIYCTRLQHLFFNQQIVNSRKLSRRQFPRQNETRVHSIV
jgi:hypothetical protein